MVTNAAHDIPNRQTAQTNKAHAGKSRLSNIFAYLFLSGGGLLLLYPLIFSLLAGFFTTYEFAIKKQDSIFPWPSQPTLANYSVFFTGNSRLFDVPGSQRQKLINWEFGGASQVIAAKAPLLLLNSLARTLYMTLMAVLTSLLGGYAFARLRWPGRDKVFLILLMSQMLPGVIGFLPSFLELYHWPLAGGNSIWGTGGCGLYNSYGVYFIWFCAINVMGTFLMRQSMQRLPIELDEAARVDGAGTTRIIFTLLAPLQKATLAYIAITTAIATWNDWMLPFFFTRSEQFMTMPAAIVKITSLYTAAMQTPNYPLIITLGMGITIPCIIIFAIFQRYIVEGLANTGIKG